MRSVWFVTLVIAAVSSGAAAETQPQACSPAGSDIQIHARRDGTVVNPVIYTVVNNQRETLTWIHIGAGGGVFARVPAEHTPWIASTPPNWRGVVVRPDADRFEVQWEATREEAGLTFRSRAEFGVRARTAFVERPGLLALDYKWLPFSVGSASGACWWGRTTSDDGGIAGGRFGAVRSASVRAFSAAGADYVVVDAPALDGMFRLGRKPLFLTTHAGLSWGVKGGFSHDASIGVGLSWFPSQHVALSANTRVGTFFFNNRTHLRTVGLDVNIPLANKPFIEGRTGPTEKYIVIGAEYFQRDVVKWAGFMKGPQWYASGHGVAIRVGVRTASWSH